MTIEGIHNAFSSAFADAANVQSAKSASSVFMGHTVSTVDSPSSLLADAAEELSFSVDKTKDYEVSRRKERQTSEISEERLKAYKALMEKANQTENMGRLVEELKRASDREAMSRAVHEAFKDPTDQWAAITEALEALSKDPSVSSEALNALKTFARDFYAANGDSIRLGLQGALSSAGFPEIGGADAGKTFYRETVGEFTDVKEVFASIEKKYGADFDKAMNFLFAAISADIESEAPSMGKAHLESVHAKLREVRLAKSAYLLCTDLVGRWERVHDVHASGFTGMTLLGDLIDLRGNKYVASGSIDRMLDKAAAPDIEHEVLLRQELMNTVRRMPTALFIDEEGQRSVLDAVQTSLDEAIAREDEYLAQQENA